VLPDSTVLLIVTRASWLAGVYGIAAVNTNADISREIIRRLHRAEAEHEVRVLYACESGSRA
jgi:hypothetical protein